VVTAVSIQYKTLQRKSIYRPACKQQGSSAAEQAEWCMQPIIVERADNLP
jgi:hypothetical protein